jgi:hypothetical protein
MSSIMMERITASFSAKSLAGEAIFAVTVNIAEPPA